MTIRATINLAVVMILLLWGHVSRASSLSSLDATAFVNSATLDQDLFLPVLISTSTSTSGAVDFPQTMTGSGWSSNVTGPFFGSDLNVNYSGDSTGFSSSSGGPIVWSSSGTYGTQAWTGSGTATFTSTDLGNITGTYQSTLTIGSNTLTFDSTISGSEDSSGNLSLSASGTGTAMIGTNPPVVIGTLFVVEHVKTDVAYASLVKFHLSHPHVSIAGVEFTDVNGVDVMTSPPDNPDWNTHYGVTVIPEPVSLTLVAIGVPSVCLFSVVRRRRGGQ